jgi:hypothetical protein
MLYREFIPRELAPGWLQTPKNKAWLRASGDLKDSLAERCKQAVKVRFARLAPRDGLDQLGGERQIERGPAELNAAFAERVVDAWNIWRWAGTAQAVLLALRDVGYAEALVEIVNGNQYGLDAKGELDIQVLPNGSWSCDATPDFWSKFAVVFPHNPWGRVGRQPHADWVRPSTDDPRVEQIRRLVRRWKSAHSTCSDIAVINVGRTWDYPHRHRTWDNQGGKWSGNDVMHFAP